MNGETYYDILGVAETATQDDIKKAYRTLAKENHPDKGGNEDIFKKISVAYDTIGDEQKRQQYDMERKNPFAGMGGGFGSSMSDLFNSVFGAGRQQRQQPRTHTTNLTISIGAVESFLGKTKTITYQRKTMCEPCNGSGGDSQTCSTCHGQGQVVRQVGSNMFIQMVQMQCPTCMGSGKIMINACHSCGGQGTKDEIKNVDIKLPHGADDGQFLRLQGQGDFRNGIFGDLILRIQVDKENNFEKFGNHLVYNCYFTLKDLEKDSFEIPHPDGSMTIKFPKNIDTSKPLRVKGKGFRIENGGDLMINQFLRYERN
jgi:molecular chaperone DnaJ